MFDDREAMCLGELTHMIGDKALIQSLTHSDVCVCVCVTCKLVSTDSCTTVCGSVPPTHPRPLGRDTRCKIAH